MTLSESASSTTVTAADANADAEVPELKNYANANVDAHTFPVMEIFGPTIQGEGIMIGEKTHFVRFGGCDYRCRMCDSMHAVDPKAVKAHAVWQTSEQIAFALTLLGDPGHTPWVTLSGGNPAIWDLQGLVTLLQEMGYKVAVETQGSLWRDWLGECDVLTICPKGPGMGKRFSPKVFESFLAKVEDNYNRMMRRMAVCIKSVVFDQMDYEFAVSLDEILNRRNVEVGMFWPEEDRYLSLGNPYPPKLLSNGKLSEDGKDEDGEQEIIFTRGLPYELLERYRILLEDYLNDPRLRHWKFLPQLHVLIWANKGGV